MRVFHEAKVCGHFWCTGPRVSDHHALAQHGQRSLPVRGCENAAACDSVAHRMGLGRGEDGRPGEVATLTQRRLVGKGWVVSHSG